MGKTGKRSGASVWKSESLHLLQIQDGFLCVFVICKLYLLKVVNSAAEYIQLIYSVNQSNKYSIEKEGSEKGLTFSPGVKSFWVKPENARGH